MHAEAGRTPCASFILEYGSPITVLKGKLQKYRKRHEVIHEGLLYRRENFINTVMENGVIHEALLCQRENFINTVMKNGVIHEGRLYQRENFINTVKENGVIHEALLY